MSVLVQVGSEDLKFDRYKRGSWTSVTLNGSLFCEDELDLFLRHPCCAKLTHLHLNETDISSVPAAALELYNLRVLGLSGNHITRIPSQLASQLVQLEKLDLSRNEITEADEFLGMYEDLGCSFTVNLAYNCLCGDPKIPGICAMQNPVEDDCSLLLPPGTPYPFPADPKGDVAEQVYAEYRRLSADPGNYALLVAFSIVKEHDPLRPSYFGDLVLVPIREEEHLPNIARNLIDRGLIAHSALVLPYDDSSEEYGIDL